MTVATTPRADALRRFLGVEIDADPREVLGLRGAIVTEGAVEAAAQRRWRQIAEHPAAGEVEAHFARAAVVHAAETMLGRVPGGGAWRGSDPETSESALSPLDARIVDAIRASGGLNHFAALRLGRLGAAAGLDASEVLRRLERIVASGGFRARRRSAGGWRVSRRLVRRGSGIPGEIARLLQEVESVVDEAVQPDARRRREGLVTVLAAVGLLLVLSIASLWRVLPGGRAPEEASSSRPVAHDAGAASVDDVPSLLDPEGEPDRSLATGVSIDAPVDAAPTPTERFVLGATTPSVVPEAERARWSAARLAADDVPARLEDLAHRIRGRNGTLDAALLEGWRSIQSVPARCWFDLPPDLLRRVLAASREVVAAVETWTAAESLVAALGDLDPRGATAVGVPTGAWGAGLLGDLVRRPGLASAVRDQLQRRLDVLGLPPRTGWVAPDAFEETAARWLAAAVESLASRGGESSRDEAWAVWFAVVERVEPIRLREALLVEAVRRSMRSWEVGHTATSAPARVDRALGLLGAALAADPDGVREVLREVATPGGRHHDAEGAWVLSSLIATRTAFERWPPMPRAATGAGAAEWLDRALASWPIPAAPRATVDPERVRRIRELVSIATQRSRRDPAATASLLRAVGRLNLAIARRDRSSARTRVALEEVEQDLLGSGELGVDPPRVAAEPASLDGRFAGAMGRALDDREIRVDLVRELRRRAGGDLGPEDAAALARAVVKDAPEVRQAAAAVLIERFGNGATVLEALLDAVGGFETDPLLVRTVERLAGISLPGEGRPELALAVRRRLAERLLATWPSEARRLDLAMVGYAGTLAARRGLDTNLEAARPVSEAAAMVAARVEALDGDPGLDDLLDRRDRRRGVAEGPSQRLAGELITLVEAELAIARRERPDLVEAIDALGVEALRRRQRSETSLEQALEMELVLAELSMLRFEGGDA